MKTPSTDQDIRLTRESKRVIDLVYEEPARLSGHWMGTEHLLLGLLRLLDLLRGGGKAVTEVFRLQGLTEQACRSTTTD